MMEQRSGPRTRQVNRLLVAACVAGALLFIAAAFIDGKPKSAEQWVPLNEAVQSSLDRLKEEGNGGQGKAGASNVQDIGQVNVDSDAPEGQPDSSGGSLTEEGIDASANLPVPSEAAALTSRDEQGRLDLNRATVEELQELKGIGPSKAEAIANDREQSGKFASVDDLMRVKGIGEKLLSGIKESVVARP